MTVIHKISHSNKYSITIHNSQSGNLKLHHLVMDKQNEVHPRNGTVFSHRGMESDSCYNVNEP